MKCSSVSCSSLTSFFNSHFSVAKIFKAMLGKKNYNEPLNFSEVHQSRLWFGQKESMWLLWMVIHRFILSKTHISEKAMEAQSPLQVHWHLGLVSVWPQVLWWSLAPAMLFILKVMDKEIGFKNVLWWTVGTEGLIPTIWGFLTAWQALYLLLVYSWANYLPHCSTANSSYKHQRLGSALSEWRNMY